MDPTKFADGQQQPFRTRASEDLRAQRGKQSEGAPPPVVMAGLDRGRTRFRTKEGHRQVLISFLNPHCQPESEQWEKLYPGYRRWIQNQQKQGKIDKSELTGKYQLIARELEVLDEIGKYYIRLRPVAGRHTAVFETGSPVVADYIRWRIRRGDFPMIYEETRSFEVIIGGRSISLRPESLEDQAVLANYFATVDAGGEMELEVAS